MRRGRVGDRNGNGGGRGRDVGGLVGIVGGEGLCGTKGWGRFEVEGIVATV